MNNDVVILGVGNVLQSDDGAGVRALRALQADPPPGALLVEIGVAILDAGPFLEGARRAIILDAVQGGGRPGRVYVLDADELESARPATSLHGFGVLDAFRLLCPGSVLPPVVIVGVEPARLGYGTKLSAPVAAALPRLVETARALAARARAIAEGVCA
ncbi:MAG: hydrogenase maturation protease [Kiritimatiellae bacterium]|nr:hydrogenase maturation protease [Kiritimatiellia bacterium]